MPRLELYYPCKPFKVNQPFGGNFEYYASILKDKEGKPLLKGHNGLDLYAPDNWIVRASHDGEVTFTGEDGSGGLGVVIRTIEPFEYEGGISYFKTIYWHLKRGCIYVKASQRVRAGDVIALADNTGLSTGSHLHFGLKPVYKGEKDWEWYNSEQNNGYQGAIDPAPYFKGFYAEEAKKVIDLEALLEVAKQRLKKLLELFKTKNT